MTAKPDYPEHRTYVGKPEAFDLLGGRHFMLLFLLGIRENHKLLDFGCGSLRSGRLLIPYLNKGNYFGIDPNKWLIESGVKFEVGESVMESKAPRFDYNQDTDLSVFGEKFDFIHAHSVFTHAPQKMISKFFSQAARTLNDRGLVLATFAGGNADYAGEEWIYPGLAYYTLKTFQKLAEQSGLAFARLKWPHPEQTYFVAAKEKRVIDGALKQIKDEYGFEIGFS